MKTWKGLLREFWEHVSITAGPNECWGWNDARNSRGYGTFTYKGQAFLAHRLAFTLSGGEIPKGYHVCHSCDTPSCCNPRHLWVGTTQENTADKVRKGRQAKGETHGYFKHPEKVARGERHGGAKLKRAQVEEMLRLYATGEYTHQQIADMYGVDRSAMSAILRGRIWVEVDRALVDAAREAGSSRSAIGARISRGNQDTHAGEKNGRAKITEQDAEEIRTLYEAGSWSQQRLGDRYGVNQRQISNIVRGQHWGKK